MNKIDLFEITIKNSIKNNNKKTGQKEVRKIHKYLEHKTQVSSDVTIRLLRLCCNYYHSFDLIHEHIKTLESLANFYLEFNAMQAAYRAIVEASEIAMENDKLKEFIGLHKLLLTACFHDKDLDGAIECYEIIKQLSTDVPIDVDVMFNIGTVYLQKNRLDEAIEIFEKIISHDSALIKFNCQANLAICHRQKNNINKSLSILEKMDSSCIHDVDYVIEFELIYSKSLILGGKFSEAIVRMTNAVKLIEYKMESVLKLYYRRGLREKYVSRLERLILSIPPEKINTDILYVLSFTRSNQTSDWMNILEWCDGVYENVKVSIKDISDLEISVQHVANNGAPFLYGMLEKYDDHHDVHNRWRWDNLTSIISTISNNYNIQSPLSIKCTERIYEILLAKVNNSSVIISFLSMDRKLMLINKGKFEVVTLDEELFFGYLSKVFKYKLNELKSNVFAREVEIVQKQIFELISEFLIASDELNNKSLIYLPDRYDYFPITSCVLKNESLRMKMTKGDYSFKTVPVLFPQCAVSADHEISKVLGIHDEISLKLSKCEIENLKKNLKISTMQLIDQYNKNDFKDGISDADILHVTTHGFPQDFYTDPDWASLDESHVINTHSIQTKLYRLDYRLVILNSCHSSSNLDHKQISLTSPNSTLNMVRSYDTFNFPTIFLINRKSCIVASSWKTFDKFSYILTDRFSKNMADFDDIEKSFSISMAEITSVTESTIESILDSSVGEQEIMIENKRSTVQMLNHPYSYATFQFYALL